MKASELKKELAVISLMSNEVNVKDAITTLMQQVKVISRDESLVRTALSIGDKREIISFLLGCMRNTESIGKTDLIKITAKKLNVRRKQVEAVMIKMISDGTIVEDKDAPRTNNRAIIYKPA